MVQQVLMGTG